MRNCVHPRVAVMNIFQLATCLTLSAAYLMDAHVSKMVIEATQILYAAHYMLGTSKEALDESHEKGAYRKCYQGNRFTLWAGETLGNYMLLAQYGLAMAAEYHLRYPDRKGGEHACVPRLRWLCANPPKSLLVDPDYTTTKGAIDEETKKLYQAPEEPSMDAPLATTSFHDDVVSAYRSSYINKVENMYNTCRAHELVPAGGQQKKTRGSVYPAYTHRSPPEWMPTVIQKIIKKKPLQSRHTRQRAHATHQLVAPLDLEHIVCDFMCCRDKP